MASHPDATAPPQDRPGGGWRGEVISAFVRADPMLYTSYLFHLQASAMAVAPDSPESYFAFLLWMVVHGRNGYTQPLVIGDEVREALAFPDATGFHPLMAYVAEQSSVSLRGDALRAWFYREAVPARGLGPFLSRAELAALAAPAAVPPGRPAQLEGERLFALGGRPRDDAGHEASLARLAARTAAAVQALPRVSIIGLHRSVLGLGEDARCLHDSLVEIGVAAELVDVSPAGLEADPASAERYRAYEVKHPTAPVLVFCLPAPEMMRAIAGGMTRPSEAQYRIGYWPWETTALPSAWHHVYDFVDEIWALSGFLGQVYAPQTEKPVLTVPPHVRVARPELSDELRAVFDGRFTFLSVFDFNSRIERKNPLGTIEAFRRAFPREADDVQLVLKTINGDKRTAAFDAVRQTIGNDPRVVVIDGALSRAELAGLIATADAYVSLHRAEGFGRPLAEAMLLGTPVVATGWSGPADFLDEETGWPVRSTLRRVDPGEYPFAAGRWAEPDLGHAAAHMRTLYAGAPAAARVIEAARRKVTARYGLEPVAANLSGLLAKRFG